MSLEIALFIAGAIVSWLIQHLFSARSAKEQRVLFNKLSAELRYLILKDPREQLSVAELNELIEQRTVDPTSREPLPYVACPKCGSSDLQKRESFDALHDETYYIVRCKTCGWGDWTQ
jgi:hypothetical protein